MTTFIIIEKQNSNSSRKGEKVEAANLAAAKRKATGLQLFQGTVMEITDELGNRLAIKTNGRWE